jgi:DNA ligase-1
MVRAIARAYALDDAYVHKQFKKHGDLGTAAEALHTDVLLTLNKTLEVTHVHEKFTVIANTGGVGSQEKKISLIAELLQSVSPLSARYIVRIPLNKLRLGFSDMTILDALSWMIKGDKSLREPLEAAYNVRPDIGFIARTIKEKGIGGFSHLHGVVGAPILAALCQRLPTADEMIKKMGTVVVEPKYDGERVQIHFQSSDISHQSSDKINTYSRNLENTTAMFPELSAMGKELHAKSVILDCEAIGIDPKTKKLISFQVTMTRKRKHDIAATSLTVPLKFFVFDILNKDGKDLLSLPLSERRDILNKTVKPGNLFELSPQIVTDSAPEIRAYHDAQLKKGLEGVVVKKWSSPYTPGRKSYSWVKFKEEEGKTGKLTDTIDAVVMGYYKGQGKRTAFGIGAFLVGVRKGEEFVTVTKIGTGVSDELWKQLKTLLNTEKVLEQPKEYVSVNKLFTPDVWIKPKIVVELAGDDLTKSPAHGALYAVRFPRLVKIRDDKSPQQATSVKELETMFKNQ